MVCVFLLSSLAIVFELMNDKECAKLGPIVTYCMECEHMAQTNTRTDILFVRQQR